MTPWSLYHVEDIKSLISSRGHSLHGGHSGKAERWTGNARGRGACTVSFMAKSTGTYRDGAGDNAARSQADRSFPDPQGATAMEDTQAK